MINAITGIPNMKQKKNPLTIRYVFEMCLNDDERMKAFNNTPKYKWDTEVESGYQGLDIAFDWKTSPEGWDYWNKVAQCSKITFQNF